jgi:phosphoribosylanthranilate isomerase
VKRCRIKICGLTRPEDVTAAVESGADALGFVFFSESPRAVDLQQMTRLLPHIPAFVQTVGLFVNPEPDWVEEVCTEIPLDLLQFHGDEPRAFCERFEKPYIKAIRVRPDTDLLQYCHNYSSARGVLMDAYHPDVWGGSGQSFDWSLIPKDCSRPVILSGGLNEYNVGEAIRAVRPFAVDVSSGVEISKGIKDAHRIQAFINGVWTA